jgi:hypothetical protein
MGANARCLVIFYIRSNGLVGKSDTASSHCFLFATRILLQEVRQTHTETYPISMALIYCAYHQ